MCRVLTIPRPTLEPVVFYGLRGCYALIRCVGIVYEVDNIFGGV